MTQNDRLNAMSIEEKAQFLETVRCNAIYGADCGFPYCHAMNGDLCNGIKEHIDEELIEWLQSEVKESAE